MTANRQLYVTDLVSLVTLSPNDADTSVSQNLQFKEILPNLKLKNMNRLAIGHLNINLCEIRLIH